MATVTHTRTIEHTGEGEDREYSVSCSCRTAYVGRLRSHTEAVEVDRLHKAAVASGEWEADQAEQAAARAALAPLHDAQRAAFDAKEARTSAAFGVVIARQKGGDVEAARADLAEADAALAAADAHLDTFRVGA